MTTALLDITEDEFDRTYTPVPNPLNPHAGWAYGENRGCLFEAYGDECEFVRRADSLRVLTLVEGDDGEMLLVSGRHNVNRVGYLITREAVPAGMTIVVTLESSEDYA